MILDAIYLFQGIRWEDYENAMAGALRNIPEPVGEILVKFHFADPDPEGKFASLKRRLADVKAADVRLLGRDFVVEDHLTACDLLVFALTSFGYYAALSGARVCCFAGGIHGLPLDSLAASGKIPADFAQVAGMCEPPLI